MAEPRRALQVHDLMTGGRDYTQAKERRERAIKIIKSVTFEIYQWNSNVDTKLAKTGVAGRSQSKATFPESGHLQRLMLGLVNDPLRAKITKETISFLKGSPGRSHLARTITALAVVYHLSQYIAVAAMVRATERVIVRLGRWWLGLRTPVNICV